MRKELAYGGRIQFLDENREVEILRTDLDEALIGTALLDDCRLTIDFAKGMVDLKKSSKRRR